MKRGRKKITTDVIVKKTTGNDTLKGKYIAEVNGNVEGFFKTIGEVKKYFENNGIKVKIIRPKEDVTPKTKKRKVQKTEVIDKVDYKDGDTVNVYGTVYEYNAEDNRFYVKGTKNIDTIKG